MSRYANLSRDELIARLEEIDTPGGSTSRTKLSDKINSQKTDSPSRRKAKDRNFDFSAVPTRHVALLLTYHGWPYSGLAIQGDRNIPTVEGELLKALGRVHLIDPEKGFEGCSYSRCGRTDRGVSGEGQVVNLYVRSARKGGKGWKAAENPPIPKSSIDTEAEGGSESSDSPKPLKTKKEAEVEFSYPRLLNGVLPPSIRVVAWAPIDDGFDARFSCVYRHYKYPFHIDGLDLSRMREAAALLIGDHDFRNFCKLDGSKQIENHARTVVKAYFDEQEATGMVVFNLIGTAFLWHQVRHIIASIFLIGRGIEGPELIKELLDTVKNPSKPSYTMGAPLPLTLYECGYKEPPDWRIGGYDGPFASLDAAQKKEIWLQAMAGRDKLERELTANVQQSELMTWQIEGGLRTLRKIMPEVEGDDQSRFTSYPIGGGEMIVTASYHKVLNRVRGEVPEVVNRKWRESKERRTGVPFVRHNARDVPEDE